MHCVCVCMRAHVHRWELCWSLPVYIDLRDRDRELPLTVCCFCTAWMLKNSTQGSCGTSWTKRKRASMKWRSICASRKTTMKPCMRRTSNCAMRLSSTMPNWSSACTLNNWTKPFSSSRTRSRQGTRSFSLVFVFCTCLCVCVCMYACVCLCVCVD